MERAIDTETVERKKYSLESRRLHRQLNDVSERRDQLAKELAECQKSVDSQTVIQHCNVFSFLPAGYIFLSSV